MPDVLLECEAHMKPCVVRIPRVVEVGTSCKDVETMEDSIVVGTAMEETGELNSTK